LKKEEVQLVEKVGTGGELSLSNLYSIIKTNFTKRGGKGVGGGRGRVI